ncbi:MAG: radical SAM protein [Candidatus Omnitrophica bacterium]|nr:radical SAM protein [Candidatus Omnitrophota bacterium]
MNNRSVYIFTNGCPENRLDCAYVEEQMHAQGWELASNAQAADLILFNACGLTNEAERYSMSIIKELALLKKKDAKIYVWGCLPKINSSLIERKYLPDQSDLLPNVKELLQETEVCTRVTANRYSDRINDRSDLYKDDPYKNIMAKMEYLVEFMLEFTTFSKVIKKILDMKRGNRDTGVYTKGVFPIKVSSGCMSSCSFCAVKLSRKHLQSKPIDKVINEFENGLRQGYKKIFLIGTDVGAYGRDEGHTLVDLLREMIRREGDYEIMLRNLHPKYLIEMLPGLLDVLKSGKITTLCSAIEAGSDSVLARMRRSHGVKEYVDAILLLKERYPHLKVRSQIMVGFPGETDADFKATEALIERMPFDFVEIYKFQPRAGTDARTYEQLPAGLINARYSRLLWKSLFKK